MVSSKIIPVDETLTDLSAQIAKIDASIVSKIAANMITQVNEKLDQNLKIDIIVLRRLLSSFESRLRECEIIYYSYLRDADHGILSGSTAGLPLTISIRLKYASNVMEKDISINDKTFYREIIDAQFRHFILAMASQYEVVVKLAEMLIRKVIIHLPQKKAPSSTLETYITLLNGLVDLRYRTQDGIFNCLEAHRPFLSKYLDTISQLRNSFIHGFSVNLQSDGASYKIIKFEKPFNESSPELELDVFSRAVMDNSRIFFIDMLDALDNAIKDHTVFIPA